jgi:hypothetical protein
MPLHVVEDVPKIEELMTKVEERLSKLNIDHDKVIYTLSNLDALCIVTDKLTEEQMDTLTDEQLVQLVADVAANFNNIDWYEWGTAGFHYHMSKIEEESEEAK